VSNILNAFGQPIGAPLANWTARPRPPVTPIQGKFCRVIKLDPAAHAADLFAGNRLDIEGRNWTYLPYGPFEKLEDYRAWLDGIAKQDDPLFHTIIDLATNKAVGIASLMRIDPPVGVIEVGHINYSPLLQRKPHATEAMFLLMARVFDELGYRRYEWKCDNCNEPSRKAAVRYGFTFEGIFRQATVYRGRNRDTAWFSIIDSEWPSIKRGYQRWLESSNFDTAGNQHVSLATCISEARSA
jgi:RimJ/RimL family protein N-acetyltransferase